MLDNKNGITFMMSINGHAKKWVWPINTPLNKLTKANSVGNKSANPRMANMVVGCCVLCAIEEAIVSPMPMAELPLSMAMVSSKKDDGLYQSAPK